MRARKPLAAMIGLVLATLLFPAVKASPQEARPVSVAFSPTGGRWLAWSDGRITTVGSAVWYGDLRAQRLNQPVSELLPTQDGRGYWLLSRDGGVFAFGDAEFYGSASTIHIADPIVSMAATPDDHGYWLLSTDGGVYSFGNAEFFGSAASYKLASPAVMITEDPLGGGYWILAADGGIFAFGRAGFFGSAAALRLHQPAVALAPTSDGRGYWIAATDGGVFTYGDARFAGSSATIPDSSPTENIVANDDNHLYCLLLADGTSRCFGQSQLKSKATGLGTPAPSPHFTPPSQTTKPPVKMANYDAMVLADHPVLFLDMSTPNRGQDIDLSGHHHDGTYYSDGTSIDTTEMPNGDYAAEFNGLGQYLEVPSSPALSVPTTGTLTIEAWIDPRTLEFPREEGTGYVNLLGKAVTDNDEYQIRMYSLTNNETPSRPNRISGYAFNLSGGEGSGSYFQDPIIANQWIMVDVTISENRSVQYPFGYVSIYKNGNLRETVGLNQFNVTPQMGDAPLRVGTTNFDSFFEGAIGKVAIYNYAVPSYQLQALYAAMTGS